MTERSSDSMPDEIRSIRMESNFDYIKQHQRVAFPTWIFLKNIDESEIKIDYEITSKNAADILKGEIVLYK
ncbi:hypothetical protein [Lachnobacterium bovis]|uniref:hypothetical protein n=2 Tax=Lachnobacterium bovis TaxID=140626 RepID=UPI0012DEBD33|nr:hypothetical protein [Lachnobacterium bovis]